MSLLSKDHELILAFVMMEAKGHGWFKNSVVSKCLTRFVLPKTCTTKCLFYQKKKKIVLVCDEGPSNGFLSFKMTEQSFLQPVHSLCWLSFGSNPIIKSILKKD